MGRRPLSCIFLLLCQVCVSQAPVRPPAAQPANPQVYRNRASGFCYSIPFGWVDRTKEMGEGSEASDGGRQPSQVLLAVFERPPQAPVSDVNPAVIIASEPVTAYQGLKTAADYFTPLAEVTSSHGLKMEGEPYDSVVNARHLVRGDFARQSGQATFHQSTLVMLDKGSVLSFTFIAENLDSVNNLIAGLRFGPCGNN